MESEKWRTVEEELRKKKEELEREEKVIRVLNMIANMLFNGVKTVEVTVFSDVERDITLNNSTYPVKNVDISMLRSFLSQATFNCEDISENKIKSTFNVSL